MNDNISKIYLSRRNLLALLSKLDRQVAGEETLCTIIKHQHDSPEYQQTMKNIAVFAVEDDEYYEAQNRRAGAMHPADEVNITQPSTGVVFKLDL
jgi:hypothetical protein